jgi:hypothetical protein
MIQIIIKILITTAIIAHYRKLPRRMFLAPNTSTSLQTTFAADAHPVEGQFLHEEQTLNNAKSLIYRTRTRRPTISKTEGQILKPR